ncbi:MAG TPA: hypothetical protein DD727_06510 [Clostridiales bacterium]|nr:hypothetical protein [Clostridiales bacterium]
MRFIFLKKVRSIFSCMLIFILLLSACSSYSRGGNVVTRNDVLSIRNGKYYLDGKPFSEISFNKFDLFWSIWDEAYAGRPIGRDNPKVAAQAEALKELHDLGFRTIRFFALPFMHADWRKIYEDPDKRESVFYKAMDLVLDLCDENGIKVVYSLACGAFIDRIWSSEKASYLYGEEHTRELVGNPNSKSRQRLYAYLEDIVNRYKERKTILMWEISNELTNSADIGSPGDDIYQGQRMPGMAQLAAFFNDTAKKIKSIDPLRLVNNGGSHLREHAWNLYLTRKWVLDTPDEQFKVYKMLYEGSQLDVIDIHYYNIAAGGYYVAGPNGTDSVIDLEKHMEFSLQLGKPLYIGEYGPLPLLRDHKIWQTFPDYFESYQDEAAVKWFQKALDELIEAGVPLTHWWCYQSDRNQDQNKKDRMDLDIQRDPELLRMIADANQKLKQKLGTR